MRNLPALAVFLVLVAAAAFFAAQFEPGAWYASLRKPPLTPPNWIFAPVWSLLYLGIAVAAWLVWREGSSGRGAMPWWGIQLLLNALWSMLFFGWHRTGWALLEIIALVAVVAGTTLVFYRVRRLAGWIFLPYLLWVSFATYLNAGVWLMN